MKVSLRWLQDYFETPLPEASAVADAFTFHAFEIEEREEGEDEVLDVKVLPNRAADCLSHRGIAKELSAILSVPLKKDPLREALPVFPKTDTLTIEIEDPGQCARYMGARVKNVTVGPSPEWLRAALESVGQRSINNIVDATNYVMLNIGQPLHAFDAAKLMHKEGTYALGIRTAKTGEKITTLSGDAYELPEGTVLITDAHADTPLGIAGVKGGKSAEITADTTDLIIESANFDGTSVRRTAQKLKLFTDASLRFQNRPAPELCAYGMRDVLALIEQVAGGEIEGVVEVYTGRPANPPVSVALERINELLGSAFSSEAVMSVFRRLGLETTLENDTFTVTPPFERTDLTIPEDLIEEVGRIEGYDRIPPTELSPLSAAPDQSRFRGIEQVKDFLIARGFTELSTQSFAKKGAVLLANPLDKSMPALRASLDAAMDAAVEQAKRYTARVLEPNQKLKLFELGTIFPERGEQWEVKTSEPVPDLPKIHDEKEYRPQQYRLGAFRPFSLYPFIVRDLALWVPETTSPDELEETIRTQAGALLVRLDQFDRFEKEGKISYAFRLVFESQERTLTDDEVSGYMENITAALAAKGYEVR